MSEESKKPSIARERQKISPIEAREAAAEAGGFLASIIITVGGKDYEVPQRGLLDDDQRAALDQLEFESQSWDRMEDGEIPEIRTENKDKDGAVTSVEVIPARKIPGQLKLPYQKGGELIKPSYAVRVAVAIFGQAKYEEYRAAGGRATDVTATLARLDRAVTKREQGDEDEDPDPKSVGGDN